MSTPPQPPMPDGPESALDYPHAAGAPEPEIPAYAYPVQPAYPVQQTYAHPVQQAFPPPAVTSVPPQYGVPVHPGYPQPGYQQPGYPAQPAYPVQPGLMPTARPAAPPPGYQPPGHQPPSYLQPAPQAAVQPGYQPGLPSAPLVPIDLKPGVIALRPLSLGDLYNGAVAFIRSNPKPTLGLTTIVVVLAQLLALALQVGPLLALNRVNMLDASGEGRTDIGGSVLLQLPGALTSWLSTILLGGLLTVVVGRAVFGSTITIGEAWVRIRGRVPALIGLAALELLAVLVTLGVIVLIVMGLGQVSTGLAVFAALLLFVLFGLAACYLWIELAFAPTVIVLERLPITAAIRRSFALVRGSFWRILGILLLTAILVSVIAWALGFPFQIAGTILTMTNQNTDMLLVSAALVAVGAAIGRIITTPFSAGVTVLLYADRRMRGEAFDMVLRTGADAALRADAAAGRPDTPTALDTTDVLWLTRR